MKPRGAPTDIGACPALVDAIDDARAWLSAHEPSRPFAHVIAEMRIALRDHIDRSDRPGGFLESILAAAPHLGVDVGRLRSEHAALSARLDELAALADDEPEALRPAFEELVYVLDAHRAFGVHLALEAFDVDLGGW